MQEVFEEIKSRIHKEDIEFTQQSDLMECIDNVIDDFAAEYNNGWIPVEERLPTLEECEKNNRQFLVQTESGDMFSCEFDSRSNGYDNPLWCCNVYVVAWQPLPEVYGEK